MIYCTAVGCNNNHLSNTSFHRYPKDPELRRQWLERAGRAGWKPSANSVLCGEHFDRDCFVVDNTPESAQKQHKKALKPDALPTNFNYSQLFDGGDSSESHDAAQHSAEMGVMGEGLNFYDMMNKNRHLRTLQFRNPGKFMENFDPERSHREMRKMNRRIYREGVRANQKYDEVGRFLANNMDICDCLVGDCEGCHFPCLRCGSEKCGGECRCNRRWTYLEVEVEGLRKKFCFDDLPNMQY